MRKPVLSCHHYAFLTVFLWSFAYVFTKVVLPYFSIYALGFLRCAIAAVILSGVAAIKKLGLPRPADIAQFILSGALGFSLYMLIFNQGMITLNPTTSCIIISTSPIITAWLATFFFGERISITGWAAIAMAFGGILILALWNGVVALNSGVIWMQASAFAISGYNIMQRKLSKKYSALQITAYSFAAGSAMLLFFLPEACAQLRDAPLKYSLLVLFLGVFSSAAAYLLWGKALSIAPKTSQVTNYMFLTPFLSLLLEYIVTAGVPDAGALIGGAVILLSLFLFTRAGRKEG